MRRYETLATWSRERRERLATQDGPRRAQAPSGGGEIPSRTSERRNRYAPQDERRLRERLISPNQVGESNQRREPSAVKAGGSQNDLTMAIMNETQAPDKPGPWEQEPSAYDVAHMGQIVCGFGDWFSAELYRLIVHADGNNRALLRRSFPLHVAAVEEHFRS